jgi:hypothetical protein
MLGSILLLAGGSKFAMALSVVANTFRSGLVNRMMGTGSEFKQVGWGTGAGTSALNDTTLVHREGARSFGDQRHARGRHQLGPEQRRIVHGIVRDERDDGDGRCVRHARHWPARHRRSVPANTYIASFGTGVGGTGTYNLTTTPGTIGSQANTSAGAGDVHQVLATLTATGGGTVTNAGTFDNTTIGSGNLGLKGDFTGVLLASGDSIALTFKAQMS